MEGVSIIIPVLNKIQTTQKCINHIREYNKNSVFELIIVDNASTDSTPEVLSRDHSIVYLRNEENLGLSKAYNLASRKAQGDIFCFMHNDVFVFKKGWVNIIRNFILDTPDAGVVGLYGAKTIRTDGSFRGKTIVHAIKNKPVIRKPFERVSVVDGLLMAIHKKVFEEIKGYSEDFSIHYYDKDFSMKSLNRGFMNYVLNIPFEHICATTRRQIESEDKVREEARKLFIERWKSFLPADVSTWWDKFAYLIKGFFIFCLFLTQ